MSEVKTYQDEKHAKYLTGGSKYLHGDKVKVGQVLRVTHISGVFDNVKTSEYIVIGYYNGHAYIPVYKAQPAVVGDRIHWNGNIWLRENQFVYIYCADVADTEVMRLDALGRYY